MPRCYDYPQLYSFNVITRWNSQRSISTTIVSGLATKEDLADLVTTQDLSALESRMTESLSALESRMTETFDRKFDDLARMVQEGFGDIAERLDLREQVAQHERAIQELKRAVNLA